MTPHSAAALDRWLGTKPLKRVCLLQQSKLYERSCKLKSARNNVLQRTQSKAAALTAVPYEQQLH
jgi:hypothetical protein